MLGGASAAFFMKQLDFLFLGIDHLVNTYNIIRNRGDAKGSFTILPVIVDPGFQGPQSSSNDFADFCSIARIPGFALTNKYDVEKIVQSQFSAPGFRIIGISQRLFKDELIDPGTPVMSDPGMRFVQYTDGEDTTIVSFNFSFPYAWTLNDALNKANMSSSLFNVNYMTPTDWEPIVKSAGKTKNLIVIDDSKSENLPAFSLLAEIRKSVRLKNDILITRKLGNDWLHPVSDEMKIDYEGIVSQIKQ
jgi:pyruvate/2-oxoglutarate/acetoin dehydrogenase E1 component